LLGDFKIDQFAAMGSAAREGARLILAHETAVTGDIGGEDGRSRRSTRSPLNMRSPGSRSLRKFGSPLVRKI
jgi:hypothetical protein